MYKITLDGSYLYHPWIRGRCITEGALTQEVNKNGSEEPLLHTFKTSFVLERVGFPPVRLLPY